MKRNDLIKTLLVLAFFVLLFSLFSFTHLFNLSSLNILGITIQPAKVYKLKLSLPHADLLSNDIKLSSNKNLMKVFNLNENLITPSLILNCDGYNYWDGTFSFEKTELPFKTVTQISKLDHGPYTSTLLEAKLPKPSTKEELISNIYILENGSVIQYVSVTIQNANGDLLSTYTYGTLPPISSFDESFKPQEEVVRAYSLVPQADYPYVTKQSQLTHSTFYDPYNTLFPRTLITQRADAMTTTPIGTSPGTNHFISIRSWAFFDGIEQFYKDVYARFGTYPWAQGGVYRVVNSIKTNYSSNISIDSSSPPASANQTNPINVSFSISVGPFSISYSIIPPTSGISIAWSKESTIQSNFYNKGTVTIQTSGANYASTFENNWRNSLNWVGTTQEASSLMYPPSSYKGSWVLMQFAINASSPYYANFYSEYSYSIRAGNGALWDFYYITSPNTMTNVRLD